ncbi:MAG TPA: ISAzo13 family transposase [Actinobacteria bacterium]|nr:ISAzo13 family transposase [Actinomycetota bacterium]
MAITAQDQDRLTGRLAEIRPHLDERQWRLLLGAEARAIGRGGVKLVAAAVGASADTVARGARELEAGIEPDGRVRRRGAGRPAVEDADPGLVRALEALVDPESRGDPESPLRWTTKSTSHLAGELAAQGHEVAARTVARLLGEAGYSLQGNAKSVEGKQHPDRDAQFRYISAQVVAFQAAGDPVISVDTKKKELVGNYANGGAEWEPAGAPRRVNVHDFADKELGKAVPYGVYDVTASTGWVNVGTDADTGQFAVESIRRWWNTVGRSAYPHAARLLITADPGGSNGSRLRLWKTELAAFAEQAGLEVTVLHLPPGTSKWNKVEHRLFSHISMNWRGRPLESHEVIIETISAVTTKTGLKVQAVLDTSTYPKGIRISDREMKAFEARHLIRHEFHGNWNYTLPAIPAEQATRPNEQK